MGHTTVPCPSSERHHIRMRSVVFVEGPTDELALALAARRSGNDLANEGISIVPINGAHALGRHLARVAEMPETRFAGLYDEGEEDVIRRHLERAGYGAGLDRRRLEALGFFACCADLEEELIRAAGRVIVASVIEREGDARAWQTFRKQYTWRERPVEEQFRRFIRSASERNGRYIRAMIEAIEPERLPRPLLSVLDHVTGADARTS